MSIASAGSIKRFTIEGYFPILYQDETLRSTDMIIALVGPSGAGKTTLLANIVRLRPDAHPLLSFTTREKRDTDLRGEYHYLTDAEYDAMLARGEFLKPAEARGKRYGTRKSDIEGAL